MTPTLYRISKTELVACPLAWVMSSLEDSLWTILTAPFKYCSNIVRISDTEFVTANECIHKYDTQTNKWGIIYDMFDTDADNTSIVFDAEKNQIYTAGLNSLKIFDMNKKICTNKRDIHFPGSNRMHMAGPRTLILINGMLHIIAGGRWELQEHFVWNIAEDKEAKNVKKIRQFDRPPPYATFGHVFDDKTQEIYCFGGMGHRRNSITKYSIKLKRYTGMECKLSEKVIFCGCVIDKTQNYILILGGFYDHRDESDTIEVFDIETSTIYKSNIKLPSQGYCKAIIMEDVDTASKLISGYIRQYCDNGLPSVLIKLILDWYSMAFVYVIINSLASGDITHAKIMLNVILNDVCL